MNITSKKNMALGLLCTVLPLKTENINRTAMNNVANNIAMNNSYKNMLKEVPNWEKQGYKSIQEIINRASIRDSITRPRLTEKPSLLTDMSKTRYTGSPEFLNLYLGGVLKGKGQKFYEAQEKHGINAVFLISIAKHESGNGTSEFARVRNNIAGMRNSKGYIYYSSVDECIDKMAANLKRYSDDGLKNIPQINKRYAESSSWGDKVLYFMNDIYLGTKCSLLKYD